MSSGQGSSAHLEKGNESETNWKPEELNGRESWVLLCCAIRQTFVITTEYIFSY